METKQDVYKALKEISDSSKSKEDILMSAQLLLVVLSSDMVPTSVNVEPDEHINFEWYKSPRWVVSLSVAPNNRLYYAALFGDNSLKGDELLTAELPKTLTSVIERFYDHDTNNN